MRYVFSAGVACGLAMSVACSESSTSEPLVPAAAVSATEHLGVAVVASSKQVQWTVTTASGKPVPNQAVTFLVAAGGGTVASASGGIGASSTTVATGASGIATVYWTLGTISAISQQLDATAGAARKSWTATPAPAAASKLVAAATGATVEAGQELAAPVQVRIADQYGNTVAQAGTAVNFTVSAGGGFVRANAAGSTPSTTVTAASDATGAAGAIWRVGTIVGAPNTLRATASGLAPVDISATVKQGQGIMTVNLGNTQSATVGTAVSLPPSVKVLDANNNPLPNVLVTFAVASGGGSITGGSATTNGSGVATVGSWTLGSAPGVNTLTASAAGVSGSPLMFTATAVAARAASAGGR